MLIFLQWLSDPAGRVLRYIVFPQFEVHLVLAGQGLHRTKHLTCDDFVTDLHAHRSKLAIEGEVVLSMKNIVKQFGTFTANNNISLELHKGEVLVEVKEIKE